NDVKVTANQIKTFAGGNLTVGTSVISSGTDGRILYDNAGVLGEKATTGLGNAVLATSPTLVTPTLGVASATSLTATPAANSSGLVVSGYSITGANTQSAVSITGTINTSGNLASGLFVNITSTASAANSKLADFQLSGNSVLALNIPSSGATTGYIWAGGGA